MAIKKNLPPQKTTPKFSIKQQVVGFVKKAIFYFFVVSIGSVIFFKFVPIPVTITMLDRKIEAIGEGEDSELYYSWRSMSQISREAGLAVVAAEDQKFPDHFGFDLKSMNKAFQGNLKGRKLRGGSTISQQTAKNVFLWQNRGYIRKVLEAYFTFLIEVIWGKERILEVYLNVAEMGTRTFGVEAASQSYFNKSAKKLTRNEAAKLAAVLPSPRKWSVKNAGPYVSRRSALISKQMRALGGVSYLSNLRKF